MKKLLLLLLFIPLVSFGQIDSSESEVIKEPVIRNEFSIKITDLSIIDSRKLESEYSIIVYKNNEVFQNIKTPANMSYHPFDKRFFGTADINFDGYDDFLFIDSMAMVNYSYIVYLYNPFSEKFEINEDYGSISSPEFDIDHQIIKSFNRGNADLSFLYKYKEFTIGLLVSFISIPNSKGFIAFWFEVFLVSK